MEKISKSKLKTIRELARDKQVRDESGLFVAEGLKIVREMIDKGYDPELIVVSANFVRDDENEDLLADLSGRSFPLFVASKTDYERISSLRHSEGIMAVAKKPDLSSVEPVNEGNSIIVLCDGVQDPGNMGTMIRTSAAFGADMLLLTGESVDPFNPKVVRASSGMILDIPVRECDGNELDRIREEKGYYLFASQSAGRGSADIETIKDIPARLIVAFGSEGKGISGEILDRADKSFHIPISDQVESLNVTAAVAIALYVFSRRRA